MTDADNLSKCGSCGGYYFPDGGGCPKCKGRLPVVVTAEVSWTEDEVFALNAGQHDRHPYTCGNDSRHRPLIATRNGWRCADCDYRQGWAHAPTDPPREPGR